MVELSRAQVRKAFEAWTGQTMESWYLYVVEKADDGDYEVLPSPTPSVAPPSGSSVANPGGWWQRIPDALQARQLERCSLSLPFFQCFGDNTPIALEGRNEEMSQTLRRYGQTVYLPKPGGSRAVPLRRRRLDRELGGGGYDEDWLQHLLVQTPEILPIGEIDPAFSPAIPLCRELPTEAGPIDIAYLSEQGLLTIVECKLWRNPEARREAVSQILDYAKEISRWSYEETERCCSSSHEAPRKYQCAV